MSTKIPVTLEKSDGTFLDETEKAVSLGKNKCVFPFNYKGKSYDKCVKKGDDLICATSVNKSGNLKTYAICKTKKKPTETDATNQSTKPKKTFKVKKSKAAPQMDEALKTEYELPKTTMITPEVFELPNRKNFVNYIDDSFKAYRFKAGHKFTRHERFTFFNQQKLVRDYLQHDSPYRGLLLYHGLGVGKTCASIAIASGFKTNRPIVVLLNKSLTQNFIDNLMKCGNEYFRINQHWEFKSLAEDSPFTQLSKVIGVPKKTLRENGGLWVVNFSKKANYESLKEAERESLHRQIDALIKTRYTFISMDGINTKNMTKYLSDRILDNALLIVDEVHNITNSMAKDNPGIRARGVRQLIMEANNLKVVFLSGTPMINDPYEVAQLFNLLRGYTPTYTFNLTPLGSSAPFKNLERMISEHPLVNQFFFKQRDNKITVTQNPYGFVNSEDRKGVVRIKTGRGGVNSEEFLTDLRNMFGSLGYRSTVVTQLFSAFPENRDEFNALFLKSNGEEITNTELFKSRILGLISHYKTQDKDLLPTVIKNEIVKVPMSDYQFVNYAEKRKAEIEQNKSRKKKPVKRSKSKDSSEEKVSDEAKSSYRAYSRMHCSFVFPEDVPRPYVGEITKGAEGSTDDDMEDLEELVMEEQLATELTDETDEELSAKDTMKKVIKEYERLKNLALRRLERTKDANLVMDAGLLKYSPKYNTLLNNLLTCPGNAFIYTEYKTLEGIAVLSIVLKANGYSELTLVKDAEGDYVIDADFRDPAEHTKKRFLFWGESPEKSEILRKIYNNQYDELPDKIREQLSHLPHDNLYGNVVQCLLTTKTGAEGIDLHNVRQVHIIEPYWNPVRLKQVMGRAVRVNSHKNLPQSERTVEIFTYIATIQLSQKKADKQIEMDSGGMTSDEVLFDISQRKLNIMNTLLKLIKEASIDCSLNAIETRDPDDPFTCVDYGQSSRLRRDDYSYVPNIMEQRKDREQKRRVEVKLSEYKFLTIKIRGKDKGFASKPDPENPRKLILFDKDTVQSGRSGKPLGEIETVGSNKKVKFY